MDDIIICRYSDNNIDEWNGFLKSSKMPMFMFDRNYMDYHKDRFVDHSLLFYSSDKLIALFPASEQNGKLISHGGLTYGGMITDEKMKQQLMLSCFDKLLAYSGENNIQEIVYKTIPLIYWKQPAEEDQYALMKNHASLLKVEASTVINLKNPYEMSKLRKRKVKQAQKAGVCMKECFSKEEYNSFVNLLNNVLIQHHGVRAVHTSDELFLLHQNFPENIRLFVAMLENKMIAGTVIYEYENVIHTQYLASNEDGRELGALDHVIVSLIDMYKGKKEWFDFGISTEDGGRILNEGLISQKEGFGGRTIVYKTWNLQI